nr:hypothetical protein [Pandoravirus aubagnensis]
MAGLQKSSVLGAALSTFATAMEALPFARGDDHAPPGQRVVQTIVDALTDMVEGDGADQRTSGAVPHSALVSFLDTIALDIINHSEVRPTESTQPPSQTQEAVQPTVAPSSAWADCNTRTLARDDAHNQTSGTVAEFVAALKSLPLGTMVSAGSDGIVFARIAFACCGAPSTLCLEADAGVTCTEDAVSSLVPLAEGGVPLPSDSRSFNVVRLVGGVVAAQRLASALATCALGRPDALVLVDDRVVVTPLCVPCIDLTSRAQATHDSALNLFSLEDNRAVLADARRLAQSGASSFEVIDALDRLSISSVIAPISLYRVEGTLHSDRDLLDAYPSMGADVRDVLFCMAGAPDGRGAIVLYETLVAESVLAAAYGPADARVGAAHRLANDARARHCRNKPDVRPSKIVRHDVDFNVISETVDKYGIALVVYTLGGCPYSQQLSDILDDVAAEIVGVPVLTVEREKIPARQRPFAYPHVFVAKPDGHVVFCSTVRTKRAIVDFAKTTADLSFVRPRT